MKAKSETTSAKENSQSFAKFTLKVWVSVATEDFLFITQLIEEFCKINPNIDVALSCVPGDIYLDQLLKASASEHLPDVMALPYNHLHLLQEKQCVAPLEGYDFFAFDDFLDDAVSCNRIGGRIYALPWQSQALAPIYLNLAISQACANQEYGQMRSACELLGFLTDPEQQIQGYQKRRWYPTRKALYDELGIKLPPSGKVIVRVADPLVLVKAFGQAREREKFIRCETGFQMNVNALAALPVQWTKQAGSAPEAMSDTPQEPAMVVAPALRQLTAEELQFQIDQGIPVPFSALFVNQLTPAFPLPPGEYLLTYREEPAGYARCLAEPVGGGEPVELEIHAVQQANPIGQPVVFFLQGSICIRHFLGFNDWCVSHNAPQCCE